MLMTHFAILEAGEPAPGLLHRLAQSLKRFFGLEDQAVAEQMTLADSTLDTMDPDAPTEPILRIVQTDTGVQDPADGLRWRRHPQLLKQPLSDLSLGEREARHEAVRGLYAAKAGALDVAVSHFTRAARCPELDLSEIPGFWHLSRSAMNTAVDAYEAVDRIRDASALNARIRTMYRPRALTPVPANVTRLPEPASKVSSNS